MNDEITICPKCIIEHRPHKQPLTYDPQSDWQGCSIHGRMSGIELVELCEEARHVC
jgi:hypothetical protein